MLLVLCLRFEEYPVCKRKYSFLTNTATYSWGPVLYIHCACHSNLYPTSDRCASTLCSPCSL